MTNEELSAAIQYAVTVCEKNYSDDYGIGNTKIGKIMLDHLRQLLAVQLERAKVQPMPEVAPQFVTGFGKVADSAMCGGALADEMKTAAIRSDELDRMHSTSAKFDGG